MKLLYFCYSYNSLSEFYLSIYLFQVKIWFQNRRMKWRNSKERELLSSGGSRDATLPNKANPNPDLSDVTDDIDSHVNSDSQHILHQSVHNRSSQIQDTGHKLGVFSEQDCLSDISDHQSDDNLSDIDDDEEILVS